MASKKFLRHFKSCFQLSPQSSALDSFVIAIFNSSRICSAISFLSHRCSPFDDIEKSFLLRRIWQNLTIFEVIQPLAENPNMKSISTSAVPVYLQSIESGVPNFAPRGAAIFSPHHPFCLVDPHHDASWKKEYIHRMKEKTGRSLLHTSAVRPSRELLHRGCPAFGDLSEYRKATARKSSPP
jgi:hypothetical protein